MSPFHAVPPRVARDRRDDRFQAGRWTPYARPAAGWVESVQDDTCTVNILNESITGVIYLDDKPSRGDIVEIETRGDLVVVLNWYEHPEPPPEPTPYAFTDGYDPINPPDTAWDASAVPVLSDESDDTYLSFVGQGKHDFLILNGDTSILPTDHVTAIEIVGRARSAPQDGTFIGLVPNIYVQATQRGYIEYLGPPPTYEDGVRLPKGTAFGDISITLTEADLQVALSNDFKDWNASNSFASWTTFDEFVDEIRTNGFEMLVYYGGSLRGTWDIASLNLIFHTDTP